MKQSGQMELEGKTISRGEEVIVKAVEFFSFNNWKVESQTQNIVVFESKEAKSLQSKKTEWVIAGVVGLVLTITLVAAIIGIPLMIIAAIQEIRIARLMKNPQNISVSIYPQQKYTNVLVKYSSSKDVKELALQFLESLPK